MENKYIGRWVSFDELSRGIQVGDLIMFETLDDTIVVEMLKTTDDGKLWYINNQVVPKHQIVAIKE